MDLGTRPIAFRSLASGLVRRCVGISIICAVLTVMVQGALTVRDENAAFERAIGDVVETNVPLLSVSLWDVEPEAVRAQVQRIARHPEIAYVRLTERTGHVFEAGNAKMREPAGAQHIDIPAPQGRGGMIGAMELSPNRLVLFQHVIEKVLWVVVGYSVLVILLCGVIAAMLRMELEKPMRNLARFTAALTPDHLTTTLELQRAPRRWKDEIDLVADAFRTLQDAIQAHVANLDAQVATRTAQLQAALEEIKALTITDALTGCFNRRHLDERLIEEVLRCHRSGQPLCVVICDIDHFKRVNDEWGHAAGDTVLRVVAETLRDAMRARIDWVARLGGEEFVIVLPDTARAEAIRVAERLRAAIAARTIVHGAATLRVSASFGVAECRHGDDAANLLAQADLMLYRAKAEGRNRVEAAVD